jgi:hypothetical protein
MRFFDQSAQRVGIGAEFGVIVGDLAGGKFVCALALVLT